MLQVNYKNQWKTVIGLIHTHPDWNEDIGFSGGENDFYAGDREAVGFGTLGATPLFLISLNNIQGIYRSTPGGFYTLLNRQSKAIFMGKNGQESLIRICNDYWNNNNLKKWY